MSGGTRSTRGLAPPTHQQIQIQALQLCQSHATSDACTLDPACVKHPEMGCITHTVQQLHQQSVDAQGAPPRQS